jgi:hypothetical protein
MPMMKRQGDVLLIKTKIPSQKETEPTAEDPRGVVLAEGESSGHYHAVFGKGARLCQYKQGGARVLIVGEGAEVRVVGGGSGGVDRHTPISLAPGAYEVRIQRAWTSALASRQVQD